MKNLINCLVIALLFSCQNELKKEIAKSEKVANDIENNLTTKNTKIKVYLLGSFHFNQMDSTYNVLDAHHQKSITRLCQTIAKQNPDKIFVERQPEFEYRSKYDSLFTKYANKETLNIKARNEIYQVGFRVAKMLNHKKVYQCDNPGRYGTLYNIAFEYAKANNQVGYFDATKKGTVLREDNRVNEDSLIMSTSLFDYLKWLNSDIVMRTSHASYVVNDVQVGSKDYYNYDDDDTLLGAEIVADWYRRNIMIYTKMINQLSYDEDAIFLVIGADHIPTITHLFNSNPYFEVVPTNTWLL